MNMTFRLCSFILFAAFIVPSYADKPDWAGGGKHGKKQEQRGSASAPHFGDQHRRIIAEYYGGQSHPGKKCPPGLAKKNNGCMPPGQAKKWGMGRTLPGDLRYYDLPLDLLMRLPPPPAGHRYVRVAADGTHRRVQPDIRINLYVLFVARFSQYEQGLSYLSRIIEHFQAHRVFDHSNAPELSERIERLIMELTTQSFAEQNEIWNALRTTYHPSMLYRVRMVVIREDVAVTTPGVGDKEMAVKP